MGILKRFLGRATGASEYLAPEELRAIFDVYFDQWPENNTRYHCWKPASLLPASKLSIKRAMKQAYAKWPEPIDWTIYACFFMEFADLALHLPQEEYAVIEKFRRRRLTANGTEDKHDPLLAFWVSSTLAPCYSIEDIIETITRKRDYWLRELPRWRQLGVDDNELDAVRRIVRESTTEFFTLILDWRLYILSIGRDGYVPQTTT